MSNNAIAHGTAKSIYFIEIGAVLKTVLTRGLKMIKPSMISSLAIPRSTILFPKKPLVSTDCRLVRDVKTLAI